MTVLNTYKDVEARRLTFVAEFDAGVDRVWQVWQDPRQLERWWGPPTYPATFDRHEVVVGGQSRYYMTGPEGDKARGWWTITAVEAPHRLEFDYGFSGDDGEPLDPADAAHMVVTLDAAGAGTRMTTVTTFANPQQMETVLAMGMEEGMRLAMGQIDGVLAPVSR
ncbi:SRPBCC family protein [Krasilnikovia sp. MM14-A1004]|uniref:SRPBCC family protein n=1 Tax=Krasilnikovia sp. MM14-A1004 TaxID=3373541 RepID=UPI00399C5173